MTAIEKTLSNYGFEPKTKSWIDDEMEGPGLWESATHKIVPHEDGRYTILQYGEITDYDDATKTFSVEKIKNGPAFCYFGMIDWEDEEYCDKLLTSIGAVIEIDHGFDDVFGDDEE
jgi:hypothetical protein